MSARNECSTASDRQNKEYSMPFMVVLPKTTDSCPLDCKYCYEGGKSGAKMSLGTLEKAIRFLEERENAKRTSYIWHGAEPLAAGLNFYKKAREIQKEYESEKHKIKNSMQTSGVLLTSEMADFFAKEKIHLGFSLDGPKEIHDSTRPYKNGKSSFDDVMRGINLMKERGEIPGVIAVLTKKSIKNLDQIFEFFKKEGLSFKINPVMNCGNAKKRSLFTYDLRRTSQCIKIFVRQMVF